MPLRRWPCNTNMVVPVTPETIPVCTRVMETLVSLKTKLCFFLFLYPIILTFPWWSAQMDSLYNPKIKYGMSSPKYSLERGHTPSLLIINFLYCFSTGVFHQNCCSTVMEDRYIVVDWGVTNSLIYPTCFLVGLMWRDTCLDAAESSRWGLDSFTRSIISWCAKPFWHNHILLPLSQKSHNIFYATGISLPHNLQLPLSWVSH